MAARGAAKAAASTKGERDRKDTQRERLLAAMVSVAARDGYANANVSALIARAGVSRPTFYDYFSDREDCFLASTAEAQARLLELVRGAVAASPPARAPSAMIGALAGFARSEPEAARVLMDEVMAAGPRALDARAAAIGQIVALLDRARRKLSAEDLTPDISPRIAIGALYRILASGLRRGEPVSEELAPALIDWIERYDRPLAEHRWRTLRPLAVPLTGSAGAAVLQALEPLSPGRPVLSEQEVAENQRQRILYATARVTEAKGYGASTVAEIAKAAALDTRTFYRHFANKQAAFTAVHELHFQRVMSVTAAAFFTAGSWPERIWRAGLAFAQYIDSNPLLARASLVEGNAGGAVTVQRGEDLVGAFAIFLQEGFQQQGGGAAPSRLALAAISASVFETAYQHARTGRPQMSGLVAHGTFLALAPFLGGVAANRFIDGQLRGAGRRV